MKRTISILFCILTILLMVACGKTEVSTSPEDYIDKPAEDFISVFGEPSEREYGPSCLGDGEDGVLIYDGFTIYTYREGDEENIVNVHIGATPEPTPTVTEETHAAYIHADEEGYYNPDRFLTRREAVEIFYEIAGKPRTSGKCYEDVTREDEFYYAASYCYANNLLDADRLNPDSIVTYSELAEMAAVYSGNSDAEDGLEPIARKDDSINLYQATACINRYLGRNADEEYLKTLAGLIPDADMTNEYYPDLVEAAATHAANCSKDGEEWLTVNGYISLPQGFNYYMGGLYYIKEDGSAAVDEEINGFKFDESGRYTSGNEELDALVNAVLSEYITEDMTQLEKLAAVYNYLIYQCSYSYGNYYDTGTNYWATDEAISFLTNRMGNCYGYAAAMSALARAIGYDATPWAGMIISFKMRHVQHGWCEIQYEGQMYICDPEMGDNSLSGEDYFFMLSTDPSCTRWEYNHDPSVIYYDPEEDE